MRVVAPPGITAQLDMSAHQLNAKTSQLAIVRWLSQVPSRLYQRIERLFPDHAGMVYTMIFGSRIMVWHHKQSSTFRGGVDPSFGGVRCPGGVGVHDHHAIGPHALVATKGDDYVIGVGPVILLHDCRC